MKNSLIALFTLCFLQINAQNAPFQVSLEPMNIPNLGGVQSYAFGQAAGKWLIVGGRLDGLHRRQPWAAFDVAGHNNQLIVVDPVSKQKWSKALTELPTPIQEQLSSTNMEFHQEGDYLYVIGGYGYSPTAGDHVTYDKMTAIEVAPLITAVMNDAPIASYFRQITAPQFAVTGGHLSKIYDTYYLVGGQYFEGRYNPMGPAHGPGFVQEYTDQIRKFKLTDDGTTLNVEHLPAITDTDNLHRRDYNVVHQILPNGAEGITAFSGVFQKTKDFPFLDCVNIDSGGYAVQPNFLQYYNHYHCAVLPLYSLAENEMHTLFFGGIAQFYDSSGVLVEDNNIPFVKTIARVTRDASGAMAEYKLPIEMPTFLGAGSEFIPNANLPTFTNGVVDLDALSDTTFAGYIYGGIASTAPNIFFINTGVESSANSQIFKVNVIKNGTSATHQLNEMSKSSLQMTVFPNPNNGIFGVKFFLKKAEPVQLTIQDAAGRVVVSDTLEKVFAGENIVTRDLKKIATGNRFLVTLETATERAVVQAVVLD